MLCLGALCFSVFFLRFIVFRFQESPKFLLYRGKDEKAVKVLHHIAKFNGRESTITLEAFQALNKEEASGGRNNSIIPLSETGEIEEHVSWQDRVRIEFIRYKTLFSTSTMARLTILIWITCK